MTEADRVIIQAPASYVGSARRLWRLVERASEKWTWLVIPGVLLLVVVAWALVTSWYMTFGLLLVPYRLVRRGQRRRRQEEMRHAEQLDAIREAHASLAQMSALNAEASKAGEP